MLATSVATVLLAFAHTYPQMLLAALGVGLAGGSFAIGVAYVSRFFAHGPPGHRARHLRRRQRRRGGDEVCRALRFAGLGLAVRRARLGGRFGGHGGGILGHDGRRSGARRAAPDWRSAESLHARARRPAQRARLAVRLLLFLRLRRLRRTRVMAAALSDRRLRLRHRHRRHDRRCVLRFPPASSAHMAACSPTASARGQ